MVGLRCGSPWRPGLAVWCGASHSGVCGHSSASAGRSAHAVKGCRSKIKYEQALATLGRVLIPDLPAPPTNTLVSFQDPLQRQRGRYPSLWVPAT